MKRESILALLLTACFLGLTSVAPLQAADQGKDDGKAPLVVRVYDVSDLLFHVSSYPAGRLNDLGDLRKLFPETTETSNQPISYFGSTILGGGSGIGMDGGVGIGSGMMGHGFQRQVRVEPIIELLELIQSVISPMDWVDVGGVSDIVSFGNMLVIQTTKGNHKQVCSLLDAVREKMAARKMISVETHWLWLSKEQLAALVAANGRAVRDQAAPCAIEEGAWKKLLQEQAKAKENCEVREGYHATITCMNGQTASVVAGRQKRFIMSVIPVVGQGAEGDSLKAGPQPQPFTGYPNTDMKVGYQPVVVIVQEGAAIEVRPITCGGDQVLLDLHARVVQIESTEQDEEPASPSDAGKPTNTPTDKQGTVVRELAERLDRPVLMTHRLDTTIRATAGRHTLVGGITCEATPEPGEPNLYLFVKPVIHEPPRGKGKAKPASKK